MTADSDWRRTHVSIATVSETGGEWGFSGKPYSLLDPTRPDPWSEVSTRTRPVPAAKMWIRPARNPVISLCKVISAAIYNRSLSTIEQYEPKHFLQTVTAEVKKFGSDIKWNSEVNRVDLKDLIAKS